MQANCSAYRILCRLMSNPDIVSSFIESCAEDLLQRTRSALTADDRLLRRSAYCHLSSCLFLIGFLFLLIVKRFLCGCSQFRITVVLYKGNPVAVVSSRASDCTRYESGNFSSIPRGTTRCEFVDIFPRCSLHWEQILQGRFKEVIILQ
uniref:Uncharacterized protein n=1 Tax=Parascaris univalens TaxID=6257 RepID=A0A914ZXW2_PARUN